MEEVNNNDDENEGTGEEKYNGRGFVQWPTYDNHCDFASRFHLAPGSVLAVELQHQENSKVRIPRC